MRLGRSWLRWESLGLLLFVTALAFFVNNLIVHAGGQAVGVGGYLPNVQFYFLALVGFACGGVSWLLLRHRPRDPTRFLIESPVAREFWSRTAASLPILLAVGFFMPSFSLIKAGIPLLTTYTWDVRLVALDQTIHGTDPWRLLQPLLGYPIITATLAQLYHAWFLLIYAGSIYFAIMVKDRALRYRYFLAYFLMWTIGGMAMAVGLASVGPCFLEPLLGNHHFAEQMAYLEAADRQYPIAVLPVQHELIAWYRSGDFGFGRGISAMPSMHVALAFLFFLAMRQQSRAAGWFFGTFCFVIMLASVHLGYHYAVDGYVSVVLVAVIWWAAGKLVPHILTPVGQPAEATAVRGIANV